MKIKINKKLTFDSNKPPLIVAEISANHNGNKSSFLKHIRAAHKSGADLIKIQTYEPEDITINKKKSYLKLKDGIWKGKYLYELYKKAHTPFSWHKDAFKLAKKLNVVLFSSPFSIRAVDLLEKLNVKLYKLASLEITDHSLIRKIAETKKPIIVSTGAASIKDIKNCIKIIEKKHKKIILLHSVTKYPTLEKDANIQKIKVLKKIFKNYLIGLSDHTQDINSSIAASTMGIVCIEKHFLINKKNKTSDQKFSISSSKIKELKKIIYGIFYHLNSKVYKSVPNRKMRRSLFAKNFIKKGTFISEKNLISLRPNVGLCSSNYFKILNKKVKFDIKENSPIYKKHIEWKK